MAALIQKIASTACKMLHSTRGNVDKTSSMAEIAVLMNGMTGKDVDFDYDHVNESRMEQYLSLSSHSNSSDSENDLYDKTNSDIITAPVTHIGIADNSHFTMSVFVVHPGGYLPLHDHPDMYGCIKVIHGSLEVASYMLSTDDDARKKHSSDSTKHVRSRKPVDDIVPAVLSSKTIVTSSDNCCLLTPKDNNLHRISAVNGSGAAFVDLLSPPYDHVHHTRPCSYYEEVKPQHDSSTNNAASKPCLWLKKGVEADMGFWCDNVPYTGPPLEQFISQ